MKYSRKYSSQSTASDALYGLENDNQGRREGRQEGQFAPGPQGQRDLIIEDF